MKKTILVASFLIFGSLAFAQVNNSGFDWGSGEEDETEETDDDDDEKSSVDEVVIKPYERITLTIDSLTNLIIYSDIVEQEESGSDSIYIRFKKFVVKEFGTLAKFELDKKDQKVILNASVPAFAYPSKYTKRNIGTYEYKLTLWIKEGRYKYQISNLVHISAKRSQGAPMRNYFEFYYTTQNNIRACDQILRFADKDINEMIARMKKSLSDPIYIDEDDW
jgi:hypothetical protein